MFRRNRRGKRGWTTCRLFKVCLLCILSLTVQKMITMLCSGGTGGGSEAELPEPQEISSLSPVSLLFMFLICPCSCSLVLLKIWKCNVQEKQEGEARLKYLNWKRYSLYPASPVHVPVLSLFFPCSCFVPVYVIVYGRNINMLCSGGTGGGSEAELPELKEIPSLSGQSPVQIKIAVYLYIIAFGALVLLS